MANSTAYVVEADLRVLGEVRPVDGAPAFGQLVERNRAEVRQWQRREKKVLPRDERLAATDWVLLAAFALWRGLHGGPDGCGVQASVRALADLLGVSCRMINYSLARLVAAGLVRRCYRQVPHRWFDGSRWLEHAQIHSVTYVTKKGLVRLARHAGKTRRLVVGAAGDRRVLESFGLVGTLLKKSAQKYAFVARRLSALKNRFRPTAEKPEKKKKTVRSGPQGAREPVRGSTHRAPTSRVAGADPPAAGIGADELDRLRKLFLRGQLTPANAWPDWAPVFNAKTKRYAPRTKKHWWAIRMAESWVRFFSAELVRADLAKSRP